MVSSHSQRTHFLSTPTKKDEPRAPASTARAPRSPASPTFPSMTLEHRSIWTQQQQDCDLKNEIHKDVIRTHPDLQFFLEEGGQARQDAMERILFIYAKLNPGIRYVQGMNEVLGTIYYVFASDSDAAWRATAEPDSFFCFTNLMAEMRDVYIHSLDNSDVGLRSKMGTLNNLLKEHDPELWTHLHLNQLDPSYYSLRWITTLLAREFTLPDTIRLWDAIFAERQRFDFLCFFCLSMLTTQREALLSGDFCRCLHLLQNYPSSDPNELLRQTHRRRANGDATARNAPTKRTETNSSTSSVLAHLRTMMIWN